MKKILSVLLALTLGLSLFASGVEEKAAGSLPEIRVAVMPFYISSPIGYIVDNGLDVANGFKIKPVMFPTGGPMNEAIASDAYDVATIGGAFVFGVANFRAHVIASHINGTGGNEIWAKAGTPIASAKGYNPAYPNILGSPATVKGLKIVQNTGTTAQLAITSWLNAIGVAEKDVNIIHMDFAQSFQAFKANSADVAALVSPYCFQTDATMVKVADLKQMGVQLYEEITLTDKAYKNPEITKVIPTFLRVLFQVNDKLEADKTLKFTAVKKWYNDNGSSATDANIQAECDLKPFVTTAEAKAMKLGEYEALYAAFMVSQDKLAKDKVDVVRANTTDEFLKKAF